MSLFQDLVFALKARCPVCRQGRLFKARLSLAIREKCDVCGTTLGTHDVGDGASVFLIFLLGFSIIPAAWVFELAVAPPLWVHALLWGAVALGLIMLLLPTIKAFIILLEYRHRPGDWKKG